MGKKFLFFSILFCIFIALIGCVQQEQKPDIPGTTEDYCVSTCITLCEMEKEKGADLSKGPCLANPLKDGESATDYVCDVAHNPRATVDDLPENQCSAFREGKAKHFVEVDPACNFLRVV